jgi:hypothetical protein
MITTGAIYNISGALGTSIQRRATLDSIENVTVSPFADDYIVINVRGDHAYVYNTPLKTEIVAILISAVKEANNRDLPVNFSAT